MLSKRLKKYIEYQGLSIRSFEIKCGINQGTISRVIKLNSSITSNNLSLVAETYKELNLRWLLTGEGEMTSEIENNTKEEKTDLEKRLEYQKSLVKTLQESLDTINENYKKT